MRLLEPDEIEVEGLAGVCDAVGMARGAAAFGWAAWIEDLEAVRFFVERQVGVAEDDCICLREAAPHAPEPAFGGTRVVDDRDPVIARGELERLGKTLAELGGVNVPVDRLDRWPRSEEHTSELQSRLHLVCRLLLEKKK